MANLSVAFPDKEGSPVVTLCDFTFSPSHIIDRFLIRVLIDNSGFEASTILDIERYDLIRMKAGLEQVIEAWGKYSIQIRFGEQFQFSCDQDPAGGLLIQVALHDALLTTSLQVQYSSDRFFIQEAIVRLNELFAKNPASN